MQDTGVSSKVCLPTRFSASEWRLLFALLELYFLMLCFHSVLEFSAVAQYQRLSGLHCKFR